MVLVWIGGERVGRWSGLFREKAEKGKGRERFNVYNELNEIFFV